MMFTDWTGLSGLALAWTVAALHLPAAKRLPVPKRVLLAATFFAMTMVPLFGLSLAGWLRAMVGDLSITSLMLLGMALYRRLLPISAAGVDPVRSRDHDALLLALGALALLLYPFALGIGGSDPYRSGYGSLLFIVMLALLGLWAVRRKLVLLPLAIALAMLAWSQDWYESTNLWDYLIDAPLALYALGSQVKHWWSSDSSSGLNPSQPPLVRGGVTAALPLICSPLTRGAWGGWGSWRGFGFNGFFGLKQKKGTSRVHADSQ